MRHFDSYRNVVRTCIVGCALWFFISGGALAEQEKPSVEIKLGVADLDRIIHSYWRSQRVRDELERYKTSEAFRQKQLEVVELERELANQRFWFLRRKRITEEIREKRSELEIMAVKESERSREREEEAIEELQIDINRAAGTIGRGQQLTAIFDSNTPYILFLNTDDAGISNVTNAVIEELSSR